MNYFIFNGIDTRAYNVNVTGSTVFDSPQRNYTQTAVPGRNGDIFLDNGNYNNLVITYHCNINGRGNGFQSVFESFRAALVSSLGYCKLQDSYNPDIYRMGVLNATISPQAIGAGWCAGEFDVSFSCKPNRWVIDETIDCNIIQVTGVTQCRTQIAGISATGTLTITLVPAVEISSFNITTSTYTLTSGNYVQKDSWAITFSSDTPSKNIGTITDDVKGIRFVWPITALADGVSYFSVKIGGVEIAKISGTGNMISVGNNPIYPTITLVRNSNKMSDTIVFGLPDDYYLNISPFSGTIVIDCEAKTISDGNGNSMDKYVGIYSDSYGTQAYDFPHLLPHENNLIETVSAISDNDFPVDISVTGTAVKY